MPPPDVESWKEHYYRRRIPFFAVGAAQAVNALLIPWSMGAVPWFSPAPAHMAAVTLVAISVAGLATARPGVHGALVITNIVMLLFFLAIAGSGFDA
jgi:hypothetical protein